MSNFLFHNKFHRANHHTVASPGLPDSATDPIASQSEPFLGIFYNYQNALLNLSSVDVSYLETFLTDSITTFDGLSVNTIQSIYAAITANVFTNSKQWFEMHTNINTLSAAYGLYPTVYSTVNTFSGIWDLGYNFYSSLNALSTNYFSTYTVVNTYSANWPFIDTTLRLNLVQENTRSKNFSGANITTISVVGSSVSAYWNLSAAQCAFFRLTGDTTFKNIVNPNNKKKGGEYILVLQQDGFGNRKANFESDYVISYALSTIVPSITSAEYFWRAAGTGTNNDGQLGLYDNNSRTFFNFLTGDWSNIVCKFNTDSTFALSAGTGTKWFATGRNDLGQLGLSDFVNKNRMIPLTGDWDTIVPSNQFTHALSAGTGTKWFATGRNNFGQLGILGFSGDFNIFTPLTGDWSIIRSGQAFSMALSANTTKLYGAGWNSFGELGLGDSISRNEYTPLTGDWSRVVCGAYNTFALSAGTNTKWFATGYNTAGQLGVGDFLDKDVMTPLTGDWDQIVCGSFHTFALSAGTNTKWFATGRNNWRQLGLGDNVNKTTMTQVTGDWDQIVCGEDFTWALSAGTQTRWYGVGLNTSGQMESGPGVFNNFRPITGDWNQIIAGQSYTMALSTPVLTGATIARTEFISPTALSVTVIRFICDGSKLYGKATNYYYERDTIWTYFAGDGLIFDPDPAEFYINDYFIPQQGVTVVGVVVPAQGYSDGGGIVVVEGLPS